MTLTPTDEQLAVIQHTGEHSLVCAVPGSGKTSTLVNRVEHLLSSGTLASNIIVLMYNKAAAEDFKVRLKNTLQNMPMPNVFTFHGLGNRALEQLRRQGHLEKREIVKEWEIKQLINQGIQQATAHFTKDVRQLFSVDEIIAQKTFKIIETGLRNHPEDINELLKIAPTARNRLNDWLSSFVSRTVMTAIETKGLMTYRHMLTDPVKLAREGKVSPILVGYDHILVDEYQDINQDQVELLQLLSSSQGHVMAVGDMDQCIYEWRGAKPDFMLDRNYAHHYKGYKRYALTQTFRFGEVLCTAANALISYNANRLPLISKPSPSSCQTAISVIKGKKALLAQLNSWYAKGETENSVILYRYWSDTLPLQLSLAGHGINFRVSSDSRNLFKQRSIQALMAWLSIPSCHELQLDQLKHIFSFPTLKIKQKDLLNILTQLLQGKTLSALPHSLDSKRMIEFQLRWDTVSEWINKSGEDEAFSQISHMQSRLGWEDALLIEGDTEDASATLHEMNRVLLDAADRRKHSIDKLHKELTSLIHGGTHRDGVLIATIHAAKGLEWDNVMIDGLEDKHFPKEDRLSGSFEEEERRLFYVAMTRARKHLICVQPGSGPASVFLEESNLVVPAE